MPGISLGCYAIRVYHSGNLSEPLPLRMDGAPTTLQNVWRTLQRLKTPSVHESEPHLLRTVRCGRGGAEIWGVVERGEYGYTARGVDSTSLTDSFVRRAADAELIPYYFRFFLPDADSIGTLIIQRLGVHSAFGDLRDEITKHFREQFPQHRIDFRPLVPAEVSRHLLDGNIHEISVIQHSIPRDLATKIAWGGSEEELGKVEVKIQAKRNGFFGSLMGEAAPRWLKRLRRGDASVVELFGENVERVRVRVEYNGKRRLFDIGRRDALAPVIDISEDVERENGVGHPIFESIHAYCYDLQRELIEQLGRDVEQ